MNTSAIPDILVPEFLLAAGNYNTLTVILSVIFLLLAAVYFSKRIHVAARLFSVLFDLKYNNADTRDCAYKTSRIIPARHISKRKASYLKYQLKIDRIKYGREIDIKTQDLVKIIYKLIYLQLTGR